MRVLYVNHTSHSSGAERALMVLLRALPTGIDPIVACPDGTLADAVRDAGIPLQIIPETSLSARLHVLHTPRQLGTAGRAAVAVRAIARQSQADLIHANTARAALLCRFARGRHGARPIVHIRDSAPPGRLPALMFEGLMRTCSAAVAITHFIADSLPDAGRHGRRRAHISVISDAVEPDRFDPAGVNPRATRSSLGIPLDAPVLAIAGQISPHKGQSDAIEILARVKATQPDAQLLVAGSVKFASKAARFDNRAYEAQLFARVKEASLTDSVHFLGERDDLAEVLAAADVILVPSWYEPLGLVALEAMMMERPVIATAVGGTREVVRDGQDGLVLAPKDPEGWARAVSGLLNDPDRRAAMGTSGRLRAIEEFSPAIHASRVTSVYERVLEGPGTTGSADW